MKILGIDPGTIRTGWGIISRKGSRLSCPGSGVIRLRSKLELSVRLRTVYEELGRLITVHQPDVVAVEEVFYAKYPNAAIKLGHVRGVVLLAASTANLPVAEYAPALVKRSVAGRGAADKQQVAQLVGSILGLSELPGNDTTDALAIAITHAQASRFLRKSG